MKLYFKTREKARKFAAARKACGYPTINKDYGKEAEKRYAVDLCPEALQRAKAVNKAIFALPC